MYRKCRGEREKITLKAIGFLLLFIFLVFLQGVIVKSRALDMEPYTSYSQGWVMQESGKEIQLPARGYKEAGDVYTIENTVPENLPEKAYMVFRSQQQKISVYIEDKKVYQYPEKRLYADITPSKWNMIKLPEDSEGKRIRIEQSSPYKQFSGKMSEVYYGSYYELQYLLQHRYLIAFGISILIGIMGLVMLIVAIAFRERNHYRSEEILGFLLMAVSVYLTGESKMFLPGMSAEIQYYATLIAFILIPVFFVGYLNSRMKGRFREETRRLLICSIAVGILCCGLQFAGIKSFIETIPLVLIMLGIDFLYGVVSYTIHIYRKETGFSGIEYYSMILIFIAMITEVVFFYLNKYRTIGMFVRMALLYYTFCVDVGVKRVFVNFLTSRIVP